VHEIAGIRELRLGARERVAAAAEQLGRRAVDEGKVDVVVALEDLRAKAVEPGRRVRDALVRELLVERDRLRRDPVRQPLPVGQRLAR
jgi:ClpP class serine protease